MDQNVLMWLGGIALGFIGALLMLLYKVHSERIASKADQDSLDDLERRHTEMSNRMDQMHNENRLAATAMENRWRADYTQLNINIGNLTGRIDQALTLISRRKDDFN